MSGSCNRRIGKKVTTNWYRNPIAELDGSGSVVSRFVYAERGSVPSYMAKEGVTYRILSETLARHVWW